MSCYHESNVSSRLSTQWLCGDSCTWAHDVRLKYVHFAFVKFEHSLMTNYIYSLHIINDTEQTMKLEYLYKVGSECDLNPWPDSSVGCSVLTEFIGRGFKSHSGRLSIATSNGSSVVNTIYISSFRYTYVITSRKFRLDKRGD